MSNIALYNLLKRIPDATDEQAKAAVDDVAKKEEVATKSDIAELKTDIVEIKTELKYIRWFMALGFSLTIAILKLL